MTEKATVTVAGRVLAITAGCSGPAAAGRLLCIHPRTGTSAVGVFITGGSDPARYREVLDTLKAATGPVSIDLPGHVLSITEAPGHGQ